MKFLLLIILIMPVFSFFKFISLDLMNDINGKPRSKKAYSSKTDTYSEQKRKAQ